MLLSDARIIFNSGDISVSVRFMVSLCLDAETLGGDEAGLLRHGNGFLITSVG